MKVEIEWNTGMPNEAGEYIITTWDGLVDYDVAYRHPDGYLYWGFFDSVLAWCKISDIEPYDYMNSK